MFDVISEREDDKWAPIMKGVPEYITTDMDLSLVNLNGYEEIPSPA